MKKKLGVFFLLFLFYQDIYGQIDHNKAHRRYWYYRTRMVNDFIKIGKEQGDCVVFAERNFGKQNKSKIGPDQIDIINQYIMTLALEYKLLSRGLQDKNETIYELFHLMWTINRLDLEAEQYWDTPASNTEISSYNGPLNAFMLREDMPLNYISNNNNLKHFNYELNLDPNATNPKSFCGLDPVSSLTPNEKFSGYFLGNEPKGDLTMPHDKYHSMLVALMFVVKYIPSGVGYYENGVLQQFQDNVSDLKTEAVKMAERIYHYVSNSSYVLHYKNSNESNVGALDVGNGAWAYAWPLSRMACHVKNGFPFTESISYCNAQGVMDPFAASAGLIEYNAMTTTSTLPPITISTRPFANKDLYLSPEDFAVFKAWDQAGTNTSPPFIPIWVSMNNNSIVNSLEWAELLRKVLHQDGFLNKQLSVFAIPIDKAGCKGPYHFNGCDYPDWEWSSQDRLEHPYYRGRGCNGNTDPVFEGNYPGVDYMLLHNLYYEYMNQITIDGTNGNASANSQSGGNGLGSVFGSVGNFISNATQYVVNGVSNFVNTTLPVYLCNISSSIAGVSLNCSNTSNANTPFPYLGYNLMDNFDNSSWPKKIVTGFGPSFSQVMVGVTSRPAKISVFQNLTSNAEINSLSNVCGNCGMQSLQEPADVVYRAGKEITLLPGFTVYPGANFHAYVSRYLCSSNGDPMNMRLINGDSTIVDSLDYLTDNFMQIPIHAVSSQPSDSDLFPLINDSTGENSRINDNELHNVQEQITNSTNGENAYSNLNKRFNVLPNPNEGLFKIYVNRYNDDETISVSIYDSKGVEIRRYENVYEVLEIDLTEFGKGIYLIKMFSSLSNEQKLKKIVIQ
ncbi:MAG: T9SS type A sorting domain-containing protein [Bacteroidia bacterium]|nr:T9SS type A sorting domain-containing protein [Bacteroidia bacterium]